MKQEEIAEVSLDTEGRIRVKPTNKAFPFIYRVGVGIYWDEKHQFLYPKALGITEAEVWFTEILNAVKSEYKIDLRLTLKTKWKNTPEKIKSKIVQAHGMNKHKKL